MDRCMRRGDLEVCHIRKGGGNVLSNAKVLCDRCHEATPIHGQPGPNPPPFTQPVKDAALRQADNRCECMATTGCH